MEGLGLTGVLAGLPSVWSGTIQVPEYTEKEEREEEVKRLPNGAIQANV